VSSDEESKWSACGRWDDHLGLFWGEKKQRLDISGEKAGRRQKGRRWEDLFKALPVTFPVKGKEQHGESRE